MDNPSEIFDIEDEIAAELKGKSLFAGAGIVPLTDRSEELLNRIDQTITKLKGLIIGITATRGQISQPNVFAQIKIDPARFSIIIGENVQINRSPTGTGVQGDRAMLAVIATLHGYRPPTADRMIVVREYGGVESQVKGLREWSVSIDTAVTLNSLADLTE